MSNQVSKSQPRPYAVFDIDGTLIRWQLFHAILDGLGRHGHVNTKSYELIRSARQLWKRRSSPASFVEYEKKVIKTYDQIITGLTVEQFMSVVNEVFDEYKDQVYTYTRDLIQKLRRQNYLLFAISGSQDEVIKLLAGYYGFDDAKGSYYEQNKGFFTGQHHIMRGQDKVDALKAMASKHHAVQTSSLAIGDSEGDLPVLTYAEQAIAFNPTMALQTEAIRNKWPIVIERKNVIYKLVEKNGSYLLASTNR